MLIRGEDLEENKTFINLTKVKIMTMEFKTKVLAQNFYFRYVKVKGFSIRLLDIGWNKNYKMI